MKKLLIISLAAFFISDCSALALSGIDAGSINSNAVRDLRIHEAVSRAREKNDITNKEINAPEKKTEEVKPEILTDIKYITFLNNKSISSKDLQRVIQNYINKPMNVENISAVRKEIMKYYQTKGFYSALALVSLEDEETGELVLDIKEGGQNSIIIEN